MKTLTAQILAKLENDSLLKNLENHLENNADTVAVTQKDD